MVIVDIYSELTSISITNITFIICFRTELMKTIFIKIRPYYEGSYEILYQISNKIDWKLYKCDLIFNHLNTFTPHCLMII